MYNNEAIMSQDVSHSLTTKKQLLLASVICILAAMFYICLLYTSPSPRDRQKSRMPSSA